MLATLDAVPCACFSLTLTFSAVLSKYYFFTKSTTILLICHIGFRFQFDYCVENLENATKAVPLSNTDYPIVRGNTFFKDLSTEAFPTLTALHFGT